MRLQFGSYCLDEPRFEPRFDGQPVVVQPKVLDFILHLGRHRERMVSKEELFREVWRGIVVTEAALSLAVLQARRAVGSPEAARAKLSAFVGPLEFSLFQKLDHGALLSAFTGRQVHATTYVFGNALIAIEMTVHDPRAGLYVPLRLFVHEVAPMRLMATYDLPSATLAQFDSSEVDAVARGLDEKVERSLGEAIRRAREGRAAQAG